MSSGPNEFIIPVTDLDAGGKPYAFAVRPAWLRGALEDHEAKAGQKTGKLAVRASKSGNDVVVHGTLDADLVVPCARCLDPVELPLHIEVSVLYVPTAELRGASKPGKAGKGGKESEEEYEFTAEEADTLPYDGETIVLDDLVRDELLLELPMIPLCSEACPGMSPAPGVNATEATERPVDPRLAPLMQFGAKKPQS
jgi:uncharacterized protein